jgi:hypothetical protein
MNDIRDKWWPLPMAIAWVYTRDEKFIDKLIKQYPREKQKELSDTNIHLLFSSYLSSLKQSNCSSSLDTVPKNTTDEAINLPIFFKSTHEAILELNSAMSARKIPTEGTRFRINRTTADASWVIRDEKDVIQATKLRHLKIEEDHDNQIGLCLISNDTRIARDSYWCIAQGYCDVGLNGAHLRRVFPADPKKQRNANRRSQTQRRGRPPGYDWSAFEQECLSVLEHEGEPNVRVDPKWTLTAFKEKMKTWCEKHFGRAPADSTIDGYVKKAIDTFTERKSEKSAA